MMPGRKNYLMLGAVSLLCPLLTEAAVGQASLSSDDGSAPLEVVAPIQPEGPVVFQRVSTLPQTGTDYNYYLRIGQVAKPGDWPASAHMRFKDAAGKTRHCTAAILGPRVLLTAAHCIPATQLIALEAKGESDIVGNCDQHTAYPTAGGSDLSADFALCRLSRDFVLPGGARYEAISRLPMNSAIGSSGNFILLTGFGCTSDLISRSEQTDGLYRIGYAEVDESSTSTRRLRAIPELYGDSQKNNLFTLDDGSHANLCPGDSGGPAFALVGQSLPDRQIIAVNSRVMRRGTRFRGSLLSATGGPDFRPWALGWLDKAENRDLAACGLKPARLPCH